MGIRRKWIAGSVLAVFLTGGGLVRGVPAKAASSRLPVEAGMWLVAEKDGVFYVGPCDLHSGGDAKSLCGWLVGMDYADAAVPRDVWGRSECGLEIIINFSARKDGKWYGRVLDPRSGQVYRGIMWSPRTDVLKLEGYLGIPLFGQTETWTRYKGAPIGAKCKMKMPVPSR